jgi:hypothetical protein
MTNNISATMTTSIATTTPMTKGVLYLILVPISDNDVVFAAEGAMLLPTLSLANVSYILIVIIV